MKKLITIIIALTTLAAIAQMVTFTQGPEYLWRHQTDVTLDANGTPTSALVTAFFEQDMIPNSTTSAKITNHTGQVTFDLIANGATTVTASGVQVTYLQLAWLNATAAQQQYSAQEAAQAAAAQAAATNTISDPVTSLSAPIKLNSPQTTVK